jgi:hypothetical protein
MEKGTELYGQDFDFHVLRTTDVDEVMATVRWLLEHEHDFTTLVIDPISIYWQALQDKWSETFKLRKKTGAGFKHEFYEFGPREWNTTKSEHRALLRLVSSLDMNVICNAHQNTLYDDNMKKIGVTYVGMKGIDYFFDAVLQLSKNSKDEFIARNLKDRTNTLPGGEFPMSYGVFEKALGSKLLTRKAEPIPFATDEQRDQLETWFVTFEMDAPKIKKLLAKHDIADKDDLTEAAAKVLLDGFEKAYAERQAKKETVDA